MGSYKGAIREFQAIARSRRYYCRKLPIAGLFSIFAIRSGFFIQLHFQVPASDRRELIVG